MYTYFDAHTEFAIMAAAGAGFLLLLLFSKSARDLVIECLTHPFQESGRQEAR